MERGKKRHTSFQVLFQVLLTEHLLVIKPMACVSWSVR